MDEVVQELPATQTTVLATVLSAHLERGRLWARQAELDTKDELTDAELAEYETIGETLVAMKADADESRVRRILAGLGLTATQVDGPLTHLSGGLASSCGTCARPFYGTGFAIVG